jgi:hypothetical protein
MSQYNNSMAVEIVDVGLTSEEIGSIASRLDDIIAANFYDAIVEVVLQREGEEINGGNWGVSDDDIVKIKERLILIL